MAKIKVLSNLCFKPIEFDGFKQDFNSPEFEEIKIGWR